MYFHPLILTEAQQQQRAAAYREVTRQCLDVIDRQQRLHADIVSDFCAKQQESLKELSDSIDGRRFLLRCFAYPAPTPLELLQVAIRSVEIAVDVQRRVIALMDRRAEELVRGGDNGVQASAPSHLDRREQGNSHRQQMAA
jgi:hypothetical protein